MILLHHQPSGDANCDGQVDIDNVVVLVGFIFSGGKAPDPIGKRRLASVGSLDYLTHTRDMQAFWLCITNSSRRPIALTLAYLGRRQS